MTRYPTRLRSLLRLARREAQGRVGAATALDAAHTQRLAQRALAALPGRTDALSRSAGRQPVRSRIGDPHAPKPWLDAFERLCWWGAGATVVLCLVVGALHRPPPDPDAFALLLEWPAAAENDPF